VYLISLAQKSAMTVSSFFLRENSARSLRRVEFGRKAKAISEAADACQTSNRIRDFALAVSKAGESYERSSSLGRDLQSSAKWARGYARRSDPINRIGERWPNSKICGNQNKTLWENRCPRLSEKSFRTDHFQRSKEHFTTGSRITGHAIPVPSLIFPC
jgi:hypothetical protein